MNINVGLDCRVGGAFKLHTIDSSGNITKSTGEIPIGNLVVDTGLDNFCINSLSTVARYCIVGTGTTPPAVGDTTLVSQLGSRSGTGVFADSTSGGAPWFGKSVVTYTFGLGDIVGNVAEVGTEDSANVLFSRALIKDTGGNPTTITVLASEQLVVTYEIRKHSPTTDVTGTVSIDFDGTPTNVDYVIRPANVDSQSGYWGIQTRLGGVSGTSTYAVFYETDVLGPIEAIPSGSGDSESGTSSAYVPGSFERFITYSVPIGSANFPTGIGSMTFISQSSATSLVGYQMNFSPKLPKDATKTMTLNVKCTFGRV